MITFPNCKINLGLYITSRRPDGYHNLETIFFPVPLSDALEIIENKQPGSYKSPVIYSGSGLEIAGNSSDNLCIKAWQLLKKDFPGLPPVLMHLHKVIPMGAGLGGGSSDAAHALMLLNTKFNLGLSPEVLVDYSLQLGSDCPFFIFNKPAIGKGRGEMLKPIDLDLSGYTLVLVNPGIHISTKEAFGNIVPRQPMPPIEHFAGQPVEAWKDHLLNDFEPGVFHAHPELKDIKNSLYNAGAVYASMSGTGSTIFGLFNPGEFQLPSFGEHRFIREIAL